MPQLPVSAQPWMAQGECRGATKAFYPEQHENAREAKVTCQGCPVRAECLEWALTGGPDGSGEWFGIWGGTSERERRIIRRQRTQAASIFEGLRLVAS